MSSVLALLFAPTFLLFIQYFEFKAVTFVYIIISFSILVYSYIKKKKFEDMIIFTIYLFLLLLAYFTNNFLVVKFIPVLTAMTFFSVFAYSALYKKEFIYKLTRKFYKKDFSEGEIAFLKNGDLFWACAIFIYSCFLISLIYYSNDAIWAFFSSLGWSIYFVIVLSIQILYGKFYAIKMYSK